MNRRRIAHAAPLLALTLALALLASPALGAKRVSPKLSPTAMAKSVKGRAGASQRRGGGGGGCTQATPGLAVDNNFGWGQWGSWGVAGQQRMYSVHVMNNDIGCGSSTFLLSAAVPSGFSVSIPQSITVRSWSSGYLSAYVTSPTWAADGDYPLSFTIQRASPPDVSSATSYKVYSSDTAAPTLYMASPGDGASISGRSYNVGVLSRDDHQVTKIELYLDDAQAPTATTLCDGVASYCQLIYTWAIRRVHGQHSATFKSYDWFGNVGTLTTTFNVN
jgi:hypothetical protein